MYHFAYGLGLNHFIPDRVKKKKSSDPDENSSFFCSNVFILTPFRS